MPEIKHQGKIKWFSTSKAFGFLISETEGEFFFHKNNVKELSSDQLVPGLEVSFIIINGKNGNEASNVGPVTTQNIDQEIDILKILSSKNTAEYNFSLFRQLMAGISSIKDDQNYKLANELLRYAERIGLAKEFKENCYRISNSEYRFKFWVNGIFDNCDLNYVAQAFEKAAPKYKERIAERLRQCSLMLIPQSPKVLFTGIQRQLLIEIASSKKRIRIAVAWFTHQLLFDALMKQLTNGISVELIVINDYINNWEFGLPFNDFISAGGILYLTGAEQRTMHHKFCLIDDSTLCNGSYNWTYYAEERNEENCMFFYEEKGLVRQFDQAFQNLVNNMEPVNEIIPPPFSPEHYDLFSRRMYQSLDLKYKAAAQTIEKRQQALQLLHKALELYPENTEAKKLIEEWKPANETKLKAQALTTTTASIKKQIALLQTSNTPDQSISPVSNKVATANTPSSPPSSINQPQSVCNLKAQLEVAESLKNRNYEGQRGKLRINLVWNTLDDLDLHVLLPENQEIYYQRKEVICQGFLGILDRDANAGGQKTKDPQENIYWGTGLPIGTYKIFVVHYSHNEMLRVPFAVSIIPEYGEATILTSTIEYSNVNKATVNVAELTNTAEKGLEVKSLV